MQKPYKMEENWSKDAKGLKTTHLGDQSIINLNFATFLHIFYIEKYLEFAYFDMFLVFVQKNKKCNFWVNLMQKGILGRDSAASRKKEDQNALFCLDTARRD